MAAAKKPMGRPSIRTDEMVEAIIDGISSGTPLAVICRQDGMPATHTFYNWMETDEELSARFARARDIGFDVIAADVLNITDEYPERTPTEHGDKVDAGFVQWAKNRAEARLKLLAKWDPKRYGDRLALAGDDSSPLRISVSSEDAEL